MAEDDGWDWEGAFEPEKSKTQLAWDRFLWWAVFLSVIFVFVLGLGTVLWAINYTIIHIAAQWKGGC